MSVCVKCERGDRRLCWGFDGPMSEHPDSLPLCTCPNHPNAPVGDDHD